MLHLQAWEVEVLELSGEVGGQTWERLGREVARGRLRAVVTGREVVRRGRREDLRAVWRNTEVGWDLETTIFFVNSEILGILIWRKKRVKYDKFEICDKTV